MKRIIIIVVVLFFLFPIIVQATEEPVGFTGEFTQEILHEFDFREAAENDPLAAKKVNPLTIGVNKYSRPDDPDYEYFYYNTYHWPGYHKWWVGFIVVNYDSVGVPCKLIMEIRGPANSTIIRNAILQPNQATIFSARVNLGNSRGVYTLTGKITGAGITGNNMVITRFYINDIW